MTQSQVMEKPEPPAGLRWIVLLVISLAMFGNYYIYDSISPLADLLAKQLHFTDADIGLLQGIYSFPNIIMVLIGGFIIDRIGTKKASLIFVALCMIGAWMTVLKGDFYFMVAGRLVFGLGAESLIVAITTIIARWFRGKSLSFAFGINLTIARLGSFMALNSPTWGAHFFNNWRDPLVVAAGAGVISVISVIIYYVIDSAAVRKYALKSEGSQDKVVLKDMFKFGTSFWYITLLCVTFYSAMFPFQTFAVKFFKDVHLTTMPDVVARGMGGLLSSLLTASAMLLTPLFGALADRIGKRSILMMLGSFLIIPVYLIMAYVHVVPTSSQEVVDLFNTTNAGNGGFFNIFYDFIVRLFEMVKVLITQYPNLILPMCIMGVAFSLIPAVMWPSVALIVEQKRLGTAYGLMTMIQNLGLFGFNLMIGFTNDTTGGYTAGMWIFSSLGFIGLVFALLLKRSEAGPNGHNLDIIKK